MKSQGNKPKKSITNYSHCSEGNIQSAEKKNHKGGRRGESGPVVPGQNSTPRKAYSLLSEELVTPPLSPVCSSFLVYCSAIVLARLNRDYMCTCPSPHLERRLQIA